MFLLGRFFASGMAGSFLRQDCKLEPLTACRYLDNLPSNEDEFLWREDPVFKAMGGWDKSKQEANRIIVGTIRHNPGRFVRECIKQTARQFVRMKPGGGNHPYIPWVIEVLRKFYPEDIPKCELSMQQSGRLLKLANRLSGLYAAVFWSSMGCCLFVLVMRCRHPDSASKLFMFVLISLLSNALMTGSLAEVSDRYQSRVAWLVAFCAMTYLASMLIRRHHLALGNEVED